MSRHNHHHHDHDHDHDHDHKHGHAHHHHDHALPARIGRAFVIGIALNTLFVAAEAFYGWHAHSLALLSDAGHNLGDVGGLLLAWAAMAISKRKPDTHYTYGWRRAGVLASFTNSVLLLVAMGSLMWEALQRLQTPEAINAPVVMSVAAIGVLINGATALLFMRGSHGDLNLRGAFLHMAGDALVSLGVVITGALYLWRGWQWIDPLASLAVAAFILYGSWSLLKQALHLMVDGVPADIDLVAVQRSLQTIEGVDSVHDLHVWALGTTEHALTAHLVCENANHASVLAKVRENLHDQFDIEHFTVQIESAATAAQCHQTSHALCSQIG